KFVDGIGSAPHAFLAWAEPGEHDGLYQRTRRPGKTAVNALRSGADSAALASQNATAPPTMAMANQPPSVQRDAADGHTASSSAHHAASASPATAVRTRLATIERTPRAPKRRRAMTTRSRRLA